MRSNLGQNIVHSSDLFPISLRIYIELAEQYKLMDAISNVLKRNVLAEHLKEVIDVLEQKVRRAVLTVYVTKC